MGFLFGGSSSPAPAPAPQPAPAPPPAPEPEPELEEDNTSEIEGIKERSQKRRATSNKRRGLLSPRDPESTKKTLLGE